MNGLRITADKTENRYGGDILCLLAGFLWTMGFIKIFFSGFPSIKESWWIYGLTGCVCLVLFERLLQTRYRKWILPISIVLVCLIFLGSRQIGTDGMAVLANDLREYLTGKTGRIYLEYQVQHPAGAYLAAALVIFLIEGLLAWSLLKQKIIWCNIVTAGCFLGYIEGLFEGSLGLFFLCGGIMLICILSFRQENASLSAGIEAVGTALVLVGICVLVALPFYIKYREGLSFEQQKMELDHQIHKKRYDTENDAMPEGNLVNVGAFEKSQEDALILTMEQPQKMYLRGRIGDVYTGISWEGFEEDTYRENADLFYWLHKGGFYGQAVLNSGYALQEDSQSYDIKIQNVSACKENLYLPYAVAEDSYLSKEIIGDNRTTGIDMIETKYFSGSLPQWYQLAIWLSEHQEQSDVKEYLKKEESYRDFVYEQDLQLTNTAVGTMERIFSEEQEEKSLSEILDLVKGVLDTKLTYDEDLQTLNGKNDFARYTLEQTGRGYSVHYATLATLMLRYMGVPARYVEGYYLSGEEAGQYEPGEEITLTEAHAHAWTEYYMDGVGWIPFEVTPGYIDEEEWEELSQILADGMGDEGGRSFSSSDLTYTPPKQPEDQTDAPDLNSAFRFSVKQVMQILLVLLLIGIGVFISYVFYRWKRLRKYKKQIRESSNEIFVTELYGYACMLTDRFHLETAKNSESEQINEIARFSCHQITDEQRTCVEKYADGVVRCCEQQCSIWQKIKYRYILWLF